MPRYNLGNLRRQNLEIKINNKAYEESREYSEVRQLEFSNSHGKVQITGTFNIQGIDPHKLISLENLSVTFSNELKHSQKFKFENVSIEIYFHLTKEIEKFWEKNQKFLKNKHTILKDDAQNFLTVLCDDFLDIDLIAEVKQQEKENENMQKMKRELKIKGFIIGNKRSEEEEIKVNLDEEKENNKVIRFKFMDIMNKEEIKETSENEESKNEQEEDSKVKENKLNLQKKKNFIEIREINNNKIFGEPEQKIIFTKNKINRRINDIISKNEDNEFLNNINIKGIFPLIGENKKIILKKIPCNNELKELKENYNSDTIYNFISLFNEIIGNDNN